MEAVEVVQGEDVDEAFDGIDTDEVAAHVEVCPAVGKAGRVVDNDSRQHHPSLGHRQGFAEGLDAVEDAGRSAPGNRNAPFIDRQTVALGLLRVEAEGQDDVSCGLTCPAVVGGEFQPGHLFDVLGQEEGIPLHRLVAFRVEDLGGLAQGESLSGSRSDFLG